MGGKKSLPIYFTGMLWFFFHWCVNNWDQLLACLQAKTVLPSLELASCSNRNSILSTIASIWRYFAVINPLTSENIFNKEKSIIFLRLSCWHNNVGSLLGYCLNKIFLMHAKYAIQSRLFTKIWYVMGWSPR